MRVLITGICGFVGSYLAEYMIQSGVQVFGLDNHPCDLDIFQSGVERIFVGDITDRMFLDEAINIVQPTHIFHFAGVLSGAPGKSIIQFTVNVLGTLNLLDSVVESDLKPNVLIASSSAVYGPAAVSPVGENQCFHPLNAYAASKVSQEMAALQYFEETGLPIIRTRTFNLTGPRQSAQLITSRVAMLIATAEAGGSPVIKLGNLTARRDYTDVRDAVRAYAKIIDTGIPGDVYNVCSNRSYSIRELVDSLIKKSRVRVEIETDPARIRSVEIAEQVGDSTKLQEITDWKPHISIEKSLDDLLGFWRRELIGKL